MSEKKLVSITVAWTNGGAEPYIVYFANELGENRSRLRAAQRVELCKSSGYPVTSYRFDYEDGSTIEAAV